MALTLLIATLFLSQLDHTPQAFAANDVSYFAETGHYVSGSFKGYWESNGGLEQFGFPLTEPFNETSPTDGNTYITQYFERAIFEYHPEFRGTPNQVLLRLVGNLETQGRKFPPATDSGGADRLYFAETQHTLDGTFRRYWESRGGVRVYGFPISESFFETNPADDKNYRVQYFERARFEYHPENSGTRFEVQLGLLGWQQLKDSSVSAELRAPQPPGKEGVLSGSGLNGPPIITQPGLRSGPPPAPLQITPLKGPHIGYGMNVWLFWQDKERVLNMLKEAGFSWVRQQVGWDALEPSPGQFAWDELDRIVDATSRKQVQIILSVVRSPNWAGINGTNGLPSNPATFGNLMRLMAERYKGRVAAYEVWNEQNLGLETGGRVAVAPYIQTLKAGYKAVKGADPQAVVIYGGLSPTGIDDAGYAVDDVKFLEQCYQYNNGEMRNYFDVLGAHPGGHGNSPDEFWPVDKPADKSRGWTTHPSFYFRRIENLRAIMERYGDGEKQLWLTEFGWTTVNQAPGYEYGKYISEDIQAKYLVRAYQRAKTEYPWMGVMTLWQLNFATFVSAQDEKAPWGLIRSDWSPRPSYLALKAMPK